MRIPFLTRLLEIKEEQLFIEADKQLLLRKILKELKKANENIGQFL